MPPLPGFDPVMTQPMVPVIQRTPGKVDKGKAAVRHPPRRQYNDEPLPVKPASTAPKNARIVGRQQAHDGAMVGYQLKIGDVEINDVSVNEILDYVSALELEQFEHERFREEAEILKVLEQEEEERRKARLARAAERARMKVAIFVEEGSESGMDLTEDQSAQAADVVVGKHARARPDYSKFYKKPRGTSKKFFEEDFADEEMADDSLPNTDGEPSAPLTGPVRSSKGPLQELPKRRRRKRDPVTGELLPLDPLPQPKLGIEKEVKRRRKRHPLTGELMPIGWRYDPEAEGNTYEARREVPGAAVKPESFKRLSISEQHEAKRPRLDPESVDSQSASPQPTKAEIMGQVLSQQQSTPKAKTAVVDLMSSEDEPEAVVAPPGSGMKPRPKQAGNSMMKGTLGSRATTSAEDSSPEPVTTTSITRPTATSPSASQRTPKVQQPKNSILSPSAARASSMDPLAAQTDAESSDEEMDEGEWFIESILGHRMSDPKTHPPELGRQAVMLYSVKWAGYDQPTWEPIESFGDRSFVDGYRKKVGLKALPPEEGEDGEKAEKQRNAIATQPQSTTRTSTASMPKDAVEDEHDEDAEYEIERIVAHQLSDPRSHPAQLGKTPVMLFQVKWKGFEELTWEPEDSFDDDVQALKVYKKRKGLK